jgi:hypothetical protein
MEPHLSEESVWAAALAARLRLLQANFADDAPATRQDFIAQEIERALKGYVPEKRKVLLAALADRFPGFQLSAAPAPPESPAAPETPESLLGRLLQVLPQLSEGQRAGLVQQLQASGLVAERGERAESGGVQVPAELQKRLGLEGAQVLSAERVATTFAMLLDMVLALDQLGWTLWKQLASKSVVRKETDLAKLSGQYLAGSQEVSAAQVMQAGERTRKLVASLLGSIGKAGIAYARERARLFEPEAIEANARAEKKWNESVEFACWRKYVQLSKEYGAEAAIEKSIQEAMVKAAENLMLGRPIG